MGGSWPAEGPIQVVECEARAAEIAAFLGIPEEQAFERLAKGFGYQHQAVNDDFRRVNPKTDDELLNWYRTTLEYIWELSAYHIDPGFNYAGMCAGIAERLKAEGARRVLCLGDGIGDLTLTLHQAGFAAVYHDLWGSRTADFAAFRYERATGREMESDMSSDWTPIDGNGCYDAVVSLDFLEHCVDVPGYARAIHEALKPGGLFCCQNAFAIGSGPEGSIPCHLAINDKYAQAAAHTESMALWDWLLTREIGFIQLESNWYQRFQLRR